jgi:superfamily II DNA or RNA helicase
MELASCLKVTEEEIILLGSSVDKLTKDLSIPNPKFNAAKTFGKKRFFSKEPQNICFLEAPVKGVYKVPRYYFDTKDYTDKTTLGRKISFTTTIIPREYQSEFFEKNKIVIEEETGLIFNVPCGHGKTIMAIYLSHRIGRQTLVLVPTYYLANQWAKAIKATTNATVFICQSTDKQIPLDRDFTIIVMELFLARELPQGLLKNIGHTVLDEAHRVGAETYLPIIDLLPAKRRTALSATFRRADKADKILGFHFGKLLEMENKFPKPFVYTIKTGIEFNYLLPIEEAGKDFLEFLSLREIPHEKIGGYLNFNKGFIKDIEDSYEEKQINVTTLRRFRTLHRRLMNTPYTTMDSFLNNHPKRLKILMSAITKALESGRTVIVLSKRKDTLKKLGKYFAEWKPAVIIAENGKRSEEEERYIQEECRLILGVVQLAKEGLDIDRLDTMFIHLPMKDTEQALGRISRLKDGKKQPMAFIFRDTNPIMYSVYTKTRTFVKINGDFKKELTIKEAVQLLKTSNT